MLIKLERYKEKILSENNGENKFKLYVEPLVRSVDYCHLELKDNNDDDYKDNNTDLTANNEPFDPLKDIRKHLSDS